ncbi:MAG: hypothetical protein LBV04_02225 [Deferribacteraceae bacterium]|nr:hypothetical protein [Deferribacteraceae bacterium]
MKHIILFSLLISFCVSCASSGSGTSIVISPKPSQNLGKPRTYTLTYSPEGAEKTCTGINTYGVNATNRTLPRPGMTSWETTITAWKGLMMVCDGQPIAVTE